MHACATVLVFEGNASAPPHTLTPLRTTPASALSSGAAGASVVRIAFHEAGVVLFLGYDATSSWEIFEIPLGSRASARSETAASPSKISDGAVAGLAGGPAACVACVAIGERE